MLAGTSMPASLPHTGAGSAASSLILFRAHRETPLIRARYEFLVRTAGRPVVVVWDSSAGNRGFEDVPRIELSPSELSALGLASDGPVAWLCGDLGYYVARRHFPEIERFWLVEYDVLLSFARAADFFDRFAGHDDVDVLVGNLRQARPKWYWFHTMAQGDQPVFRCFFPLTGLSARAVDRLLPLRQAMFAAHRSGGKTIANDEAFVATAATREGLVMRDLNAFGRTYYPFCYRFEWPIAAETIRKRPLNLLLHPVLDRNELAAKDKRSFAHLPLADRAKLAIQHGYADARLWLVNRGIGLPKL